MIYIFVKVLMLTMMVFCSRLRNVLVFDISDWSLKSVWVAKMVQGNEKDCNLVMR